MTRLFPPSIPTCMARDEILDHPLSMNGSGCHGDMCVFASLADNAGMGQNFVVLFDVVHEQSLHPPVPLFFSLAPNADAVTMGTLSDVELHGSFSVQKGQRVNTKSSVGVPTAG